MKKSLFVAVAAVLVAVAAAPAQAGHEGQNGLGTLNASEAQICYFRGLDERMNICIGAGFASWDENSPFNSFDQESQFALLAALEYDLWYGDNWGFGLFPSLTFQSFSPEGEGDSATDFLIGLYLGGHADLVDNFAVFFRHGLTIEMFDSGIEGSDSSTDIYTNAFNLGDLGVAFFFP